MGLCNNLVGFCKNALHLYAPWQSNTAPKQQLREMTVWATNVKRDMIVATTRGATAQSSRHQQCRLHRYCYWLSCCNIGRCHANIRTTSAEPCSKNLPSTWDLWSKSDKCCALGGVTLRMAHFKHIKMLAMGWFNNLVGFWKIVLHLYTVYQANTVQKWHNRKIAAREGNMTR